jgi:Uncharacterized conserved protein
MCGRYQVVIEESELREIVFSALSDADIDTGSYLVGNEVFPTNTLPVLVNSDGAKSAKMYKWGFPQYKGNGVIINARSETLEVKPMFTNRFRYSRCLVPSSGFFEWSRQTRQKYMFQMPDDNVLYMAGLWGDFGGQPSYVIITADANESVRGVHERMPLVLRREELDEWLFDVNSARLLLRGILPQLECIAV